MGMEHSALRQPVTSARVYIRVEALVWIGLVAGAAAIRAAGLGDAEFTVAESGRATDALRVAGGETPETWTGDASAAAVSYLFDVFGESEALARAPSAAASALLIAALWLARPFAGRSGALAAAALIGLSPLFVLFARSAEPFGLGATAAVLAALSVLAYLRSPGPGWLLAVGAFAGLTALTDAVGVSALMAIALFVGVEALFGDADTVNRAWGSLRSSPLQWLVAAAAVAATLQLGLTHFGTSTEKVGLAGFAQFGEMFELPRDSRPPGYHAALLLAYEWPIVAAGVGGLAVVGWRAVKSGLASLAAYERLLLTWVGVGAVVMAFVTRREAGQALIVLLPLALLGSVLVEAGVRNVDWRAAWRWWPAGAAVVALAGGAALAMTEWSAGNASAFERTLIAVFAIGAAFVGATAALRGRLAGAAAVGLALAVLGGAYAAHSSLALVSSRGVELAEDAVLLERRHEFRRTLDTLARERGGLVVIAPELRDLLAWTLRDSPYVFGGETADASVYVGPAGETPAGFAKVGPEWGLSQSWYPDEVLKPRNMWRWLLEREPYGDVGTAAVQIYVPTV